MKHAYLLCLFLSISFSSQAQSNTIFGLHFTTGELRMAQADIQTGSVNVLNQSAISQDGFQAGLADLDPFSKSYFYIQGARLRTVDALTGIVESSVVLDNPLQAVQSITNIAYNWMEDKLYGVQHRYEGGQTKLYLASEDPSNGSVQVISQSPVSNVPFISGNSDIDVAAREYIYATSGAIYRVDLDTGELLSQASIQTVYSDGSEFFVNLAYHWQDQVIYGLHFYTPQPIEPFGSPCQGELRLASIDPGTGDVTIISQSPVSPDCFSIGDSDIDVQGRRFIYLRSGRVYAVDIATGEALSNTFLDNPDNAIAAMINMTYDHFAQQPVQPIPMDMGTSIQLEAGIPLVLDTRNGDDVEYLWSTGETTSSIEVEEPGTYSVLLERSGIQMEGSIEVLGTPLSVLDTEEGLLRIYPNPASDLLFI